MASQLPVLKYLVGAHPPQRRRIGVDRHRRLLARVADAVDVGRAELERPAGLATRGLPCGRRARAGPRDRARTTPTAPQQRSWSWKPVSWSSINRSARPRPRRRAAALVGGAARACSTRCSHTSGCVADHGRVGDSSACGASASSCRSPGRGGEVELASQRVGRGPGAASSGPDHRPVRAVDSRSAPTGPPSRRRPPGRRTRCRRKRTRRHDFRWDRRGRPSRSAWSGGAPASIAKTTVRRGGAGRPHSAQACHAADTPAT